MIITENIQDIYNAYIRAKELLVTFPEDSESFEDYQIFVVTLRQDLEKECLKQGFTSSQALKWITTRNEILNSKN
jgi:hypothetical protein